MDQQLDHRALRARMPRCSRKCLALSALLLSLGYGCAASKQPSQPATPPSSIAPEPGPTKGSAATAVLPSSPVPSTAPTETSQPGASSAADGEETLPSPPNQGLDARGDALFAEAEQLRRSADAIRYPAYHGTSYRPPAKRLENMTQAEFEAEMRNRTAETEAVKRHIDTSVKDWVDRKKQAIEKAERAYQHFIELRPAPAPAWVVVAGARTGQMWDAFAADFRRAPMPAWMSTDAELRAEYEKSLVGASQPMVERARAAFRACRDTAQRYHIDSEDARTCSAWITAHPVGR